MFTINDDKSIYVTRGDICFFAVSAEQDGVLYRFQPNDIVRIKVTSKKDAETVLMQKSFVVEEETERVEIYLTGDDTKFGDVISKATDYWYEIELNPYTNPQTIIGFDEEGAKIFKLFPEGDDIEYVEEEDIPLVDSELSLTSERPIQNQAVARALILYEERVEEAKNTINATADEAEQRVTNTAEETKTNINSHVTGAISRIEEAEEEALANVNDASAGAEASAQRAKTEADRAKAEADRAGAIVGGDFATNTRVDGLEEDINNIQTTSKATLSTAGWYRVAEYVGTNANHLKGSNTNSCTISIKRSTWDKNGESLLVRLESRINNQTFSSFSAHSGQHLLTKIRYAYDNEKAYIEVYYDNSASENCRFDIIDGYGYSTLWQAVTPTLTEETLNGVTVTTTYDIPANASPVTDLDIAKAMEGHVYPFYSINTQEELDELLNSFHANVADRTHYEHHIILNIAPSSPEGLGGGHRVVEGYRQGANHGTQKIYGWSGSTSEEPSKYIEYDRGIVGGVWGEWDKTTHDSALANYLPKTGGTASGNIQILRDYLSAFIVNNNTRNARFVAEGGNIGVYDIDNSKWLAYMDASGNGFVNGTASGNLSSKGGALSGALTFNYNGRSVYFTNTSDGRFVLVDNTNGGTLLEFSADGTAISFKGKQFHHDGNSAKVVVSSTPLTAEGSIRVW